MHGFLDKNISMDNGQNEPWNSMGINPWNMHTEMCLMGPHGYSIGGYHLPMGGGTHPWNTHVAPWDTIRRGYSMGLQTHGISWVCANGVLWGHIPIGPVPIGPHGAPLLHTHGIPIGFFIWFVGPMAMVPMKFSYEIGHNDTPWAMDLSPCTHDIPLWPISYENSMGFFIGFSMGFFCKG